MDITVFLGAPGSGKGTQAKILAKQNGFQHLSTGDMLRAAIHKGTETGLKVKRFLDAGDLVPDDLMIDLIEKTLSDLPPQSRVILDGFPRNEPQARALDKNLRTQVSRAVYFEMPLQVLMGRLTGRRVCSQCGQPYHVTAVKEKKPGICDLCGSKLVQRPDDMENVVKHRLEVYAKQTQPLLAFYQAVGKLKKLDADVAVDALQKQLTKTLN